MTTSHPSSETLADYAFGGLKTGARLVLGVHLRACAVCRREVERLEAVGGALLEVQADAAMAPDALDRALASLERQAPSSEESPRMRWQDQMKGFWTPIGVGAAVKPLPKMADAGERFYLIRAEGGRALPEHGHMGMERLVVITGAFEDQHGRYGPGDLVERGPEDRHQPVVCEGETCLCLSATEGAVKLSGLARLAQVFLGI